MSDYSGNKEGTSIPLDTLSSFADALYQPSNSRSASPIFSEVPRDHREASASRVDIGHFDPIAVDELRRTLSRPSGEVPGGANLDRTLSGGSDMTLSPGEGPYDFEKALRMVMRR